MQWFFTDRQVGVNRDKLRDKVGDKRLIFMNQIHSGTVKLVDENSPEVIKECDGIVTTRQDVALCVVVADCNPILLYDDEKQVIAAVHAGRVGTYKSIVQNAVKLMQEKFTCKTQNIQVFLGPSIRKCCYEIGKEVVCGFEKFTCKKDERIYLDLLSLNLTQLQEAGIEKGNIFVDETCTCCNENYFSYRREATKERFCGVISL